MTGPQADILVVQLNRVEPAAGAQKGASASKAGDASLSLRLGGVQTYALEAGGRTTTVTVDLDARGLVGLADEVRLWLRQMVPHVRHLRIHTHTPEVKAISWMDVLFAEGGGPATVWVEHSGDAAEPVAPLTVRVPAAVGTRQVLLLLRLDRQESRWGGVGGVGFELGESHEGPRDEVWITPGGVPPNSASSVCVRLRIGAGPVVPELEGVALAADVDVPDGDAALAWINALWEATYAQLLPLPEAVVAAHVAQRGRTPGYALRLSVPEAWAGLRVVRIPPWPGAAPWHQGWKRLFPGRWEADAQAQQEGTSEGGVVLVVGPPGSGKTSYVHAGLLGGERFRDEKGKVRFSYVRDPASFDQVESRDRGVPPAVVAVVEDALPDGDPRLLRYRERWPDSAGGPPLVVTATARPGLLAKVDRVVVVELVPPSPAQLLTAFRTPAERAGYSFEDGVLEAVVDEVMAGPPTDRLRAMSVRLRQMWALSSGFVFTHDSRRAEPPLATSAVAALDSDRPLDGDADPQKVDQLAFWSHIEAFSSLILSRATRLPLSIGLFGDWGSGKSFFMASLRRALEDRARAVRAAQPDARDRTDWYGRVAPIHFNAWHYADADLWASLVHHLFKELGGWLAEEEAGVHDLSTKERRARAEAERERIQLDMLEELRTTKTRLAAAKVARDAAIERLTSAESKRRSAIRTGFLAAQHALDVLLADVSEEIDALPAVEEDTGPGTPPPPRGPLAPHERKDVDALVGLVGEAEAVRTVLGDRAPENIADLNNLIKGWSRSSVVLTFFGWLIRGPHLGARVVFLLSLVALAYGLHSLVDFLRLQVTVCAVESGAPWYCGFAAPTAGWVMGLASTTAVAWRQFRAWLTRTAPGLADALSNPQAFRDRLARFDGLKERLRRQNLEAQDARAQVEAVVDTARQRLDAAERRVQAAQSGWALRQLVDQSSGDRYRSHLGLMATINDDLDQLGAILEDLERKRATAARLAQPHAPEDRTPFQPTPPPRIVLFIDDLDRCPPERVVEVLEAVHLLLAKDLFVVVVAVDARWLLRSVDTHFQSLVEGREDQPDDPRVGPLRAATPRHYLEKIFQVPFQVPPMTHDGYERLVDRMMGELIGPDAASDLPTPSSEAPDPSSEVQDPASDMPEAQTASLDDSAPASPDAQDGENGVPSIVATDLPPPPDPIEAPTAPELPSAEKVRFTHAEQAVLHALGPIVQTPRAAKRLVNTARLVRLHAAAEDDWHRIMVPTLLLVGLEVGAPELWTDLREVLIHTEYEDPRSAVLQVGGGDGPPNARLHAVVQKLEQEGELPDQADVWHRAMRLSERYAFILSGGHTASFG